MGSDPYNFPRPSPDTGLTAESTPPSVSTDYLTSKVTVPKLPFVLDYPEGRNKIVPPLESQSRGITPPRTMSHISKERCRLSDC